MPTLRCFFCLLFAIVLVGPSLAAELEWQPFDLLGAGDRAIAETALAGEFGDDPDLWPDWIEPRALLVPFNRGQLLIVREPLHAPCGEYGYTVFSAVTPEGTRLKLGDEFCAGDLQIIPAWGAAMPDLAFSEGQVKDPTSGVWQRRDQHVRWTDKGWVLVLTR
jgi:hypothetical protein